MRQAVLSVHVAPQAPIPLSEHQGHREGCEPRGTHRGCEGEGTMQNQPEPPGRAQNTQGD